MTTDTVKITNFSELKGVSVTVAETTIATASLQNDTITFTAIAKGNTTAEIKADGATSKNITVNVT